MRLRDTDPVTGFWLAALDFLFGITGEREIDVAGYRQKVLTFESDYIYGFHIHGGQLLLEQRLFESGNREVLELAFLHEKGHEESGILSVPGSLAQQLLLNPVSLLAGLILLFLCGYSLANGRPALELAIFVRPLETVAATLFSFFLASLGSYYTELEADFFAIDRMGAESFMEASRRKNEMFGGGGILEILGYLSHPPDSMSVGVYRSMHGQS
jgi:hypothetical protein